MRPAKHLAPPLFALAAGLLLVALSWPQLTGGLVLFWHERTLYDLANGLFAKPVTPARLADAVVSWRAAARLLDNSDTWGEYGDTLMAAARAASDPAGRRKRLTAAVEAYRAALVRSPANARAWTLLASARLQLDATPEELMPLLRMSLRTGPREPDLALVRLDIAFYLWRILDPDIKAAMADQVLVAVRQNVRLFVPIVRRHYVLGPVRTILDSDPDLKWRFDETYQRFYP